MRVKQISLNRGVAPVLLAICIGIFSGSVNAHEKEEVRFLMNQIDRLEQRVLTMEQLLNSRSISAPAENNSMSGDGWDRLAEGMGEQDVLQLLGRPGKVHETSSKTTWFYPDLLGGSVHFESARVTGWQKP